MHEYLEFWFERGPVLESNTQIEIFLSKFSKPSQKLVFIVHCCCCSCNTYTENSATHKLFVWGSAKSTKNLNQHLANCITNTWKMAHTDSCAIHIQFHFISSVGRLIRYVPVEDTEGCMRTIIHWCDYELLEMVNLVFLCSRSLRFLHHRRMEELNFVCFFFIIFVFVLFLVFTGIVCVQGWA